MFQETELEETGLRRGDWMATPSISENGGKATVAVKKRLLDFFDISRVSLRWATVVLGCILFSWRHIYRTTWGGEVAMGECSEVFREVDGDMQQDKRRLWRSRRLCWEPMLGWRFCRIRSHM